MKGKYVVAFLALFACSLLIVPTSARAATDLGLQLSSTGSQRHSATTTWTSLGVRTTLAISIRTWSDHVPRGSGQVEHERGHRNGTATVKLPQLLDLNDVSITTAWAITHLELVGDWLLPILLDGVFPPSHGGTSEQRHNNNIQSWYSTSNRVFCVAPGAGPTLRTKIYREAYDGSATGNGTLGWTVLRYNGAHDRHPGMRKRPVDSQLDIPEPATLSVLGAALLGLGTGIRRKLTKV